MIRSLDFKQWMLTAAQATAVGLACAIPLSNSVTTVLAIVVLLFWGLSLDKERLKQGFNHPISKAIFIFIGIYLLGIVYTVASNAEIMSALRKSTRLLYFPILAPLFVKPKWRLAAFVAFVGAVLISVIAAMQVPSHTPVFKDNIFTSLFVAYSCFTLGHWIIRGKTSRVFTVPLLLFLTYYLFFISIGRAGQVLFMLLYALLCWQYFGNKLKHLFYAGLVLILMLVAIVVLPTSFAKRHATAAQEVQNFFQDRSASVADSSMGLRLTFVHNALELVKQRPIFGWGTGSFSRAYELQFPNSKENHTYTVNPHNQYLLVAVELGLVGLGALLFMLFSMLQALYKNRDLYGYLGLGLVLAVATGCLANSWLLDFASMYFFVMFCSVCAGDKLNNQAFK